MKSYVRQSRLVQPRRTMLPPRDEKPPQPLSPQQNRYITNQDLDMEALVQFLEQDDVNDRWKRASRSIKVSIQNESPNDPEDETFRMSPSIIRPLSPPPVQAVSVQDHNGMMNVVTARRRRYNGGANTWVFLLSSLCLLAALWLSARSGE